MQTTTRTHAVSATTALALLALVATAAAQAPAKKPNIVVIFGDDIGQANVSAYSMGVMGYQTPNIDRIAKEGMMFTGYYAEQSCTAGRSTFEEHAGRDGTRHRRAHREEEDAERDARLAEEAEPGCAVGVCTQSPRSSVEIARRNRVHTIIR